MEAEDFPGPVTPGADLASVNITVTADCALLSPDPLRPVQVDFAVKQAPPWAVTTITPDAVPIPPQSCTGTSTTVRAALLVSVTAEAPAFLGQPISVEASVRSVEATYNATAEVILRAGFLSIVDIEAKEGSVEVSPGDEAPCVFTVTNFGNAATRVILTPSSLADGWSALAPPPFVVGSAQVSGGAAPVATQTVRVITTSAGVGSKTQTLDLALTSAYAEDASIQGDTAESSCIVTTKGAVSPGAAWAAPAAFGLAAAFRARARPDERHP